MLSTHKKKIEHSVIAAMIVVSSHTIACKALSLGKIHHMMCVSENAAIIGVFPSLLLEKAEQKA